MSRALITGIGGQDGTLLAELLARRGDAVVGVARREPSARVRAVADVRLLDITDGPALAALVGELQPDLLFHLAGEHAGGAGAAVDEGRLVRANVVATHDLLQAVRERAPGCRVVLAGSCHIFGAGAPPPQDEETRALPDNVYGLTKLAVLHLGRLYRERHGLRSSTAILFNHESPLRPPGYLTRRVADAVVAIAARGAGELTLGDLEASVDWGSAADYVDALARMAALDAPEDLVVASGEAHTVRELAELAFARVGLRAADHVRTDPGLVRADRRKGYRGSPARLLARTGWRPTTPFPALVAELVDAARNRARDAGGPPV